MAENQKPFEEKKEMKVRTERKRKAVEEDPFENLEHDEFTNEKQMELITKAKRSNNNMEQNDIVQMMVDNKIFENSFEDKSKMMCNICNSLFISSSAASQFLHLTGKVW